MDRRDRGPGVRVLMISPQFRPLVGGYERAAERLSLALVERGHEVTVMAEHRDRRWPREEKVGGVAVRRWWCLYAPRRHMSSSLIGLAWALLLRGRRFDVWHVHQYGPQAALVVLLSRILARPVVLKLTSSSSEGISHALAAGPLPRLVAALHKKVDAIVALSHQTVTEAQEFGISRNRIYLLGNGVDTTRFRPRSSEERHQLKLELGLGLGRVVVAVGLTAAKNIPGLLVAWREATKGLSDSWQLVVIGDGPARPEYERLAEQYLIGARVKFVGHQDNIDEWLGASDIYASTSRREGLSNTLLEAMATGLPVIATRVSGVSDLIESPAAGIAVDIDNMDDVADRILALAVNPGLQKKLGERARAVVVDGYSINSVAAAHERLYMKVYRRNKPISQISPCAGY